LWECQCRHCCVVIVVGVVVVVVVVVTVLTSRFGLIRQPRIVGDGVGRQKTDLRQVCASTVRRGAREEKSKKDRTVSEKGLVEGVYCKVGWRKLLISYLGFGKEKERMNAESGCT
jgi:hypothetical protein